MSKINITTALEKITKDFDFFRNVDDLSVMRGGILLPPLATKLASTAFCINLVSLFDQALQQYIDIKYPVLKGKTTTLDKRLKCLKGKFLDYSKLDQIRIDRNHYAHTLKKYANLAKFFEDYLIKVTASPLAPSQLQSKDAWRASHRG
jgi:hypothetical protein